MVQCSWSSLFYKRHWSIFFYFEREIKIGSKILGKKHNDIWYRGTVVDMSNDMKVAEVDIASESSSVSHWYLVMHNTHRSCDTWSSVVNGKKSLQRNYTVKFDGKGRKTLSALNCAFKDSLTKPVSVGTRVVGEYVYCEPYSLFFIHNDILCWKILCT